MTRRTSLELELSKTRPKNAADFGQLRKPRNCGECARFVRNPDCPGYGWCDNWGGVSLTDKYVCNPNFGVKKEVRDGERD